MKSWHIKILERTLRFMARAILRRHRPLVLAITGSVGKSSTKEAIRVVLGSAFRVRSNLGNLNNEIGVPLTILGSSGGGGSFLRWLPVPFRFLHTFCIPTRLYPEILVLELGIDRIGDMDYLLEFLHPKIGVLTAISTSHVEFFKSISIVAREKGKLIRSLPEDGLGVLNADDPRVIAFSEKTRASILSYGFKKEADIRGTHPTFFSDGDTVPLGLTFKLEYAGKSIPVRLPGVLAEHHILAALAAGAVGIFLKMSLLDVRAALQKFEPLPSRLRLLRGAKESFILDDSYNASPRSLEAAFSTLQHFPVSGRRIVALGDMLELGGESLSAHQDVARMIFESGVSHAFLLGKEMRAAQEALLKKGFPSDHISFFENPDQLGEELVRFLEKGDTVLVKGSQGMRLEKAVEKILSESEKEMLLARVCRQSPDWKRTPFLPEKE